MTMFCRLARSDRFITAPLNIKTSTAPGPSPGPCSAVHVEHLGRWRATHRHAAAALGSARRRRSHRARPGGHMNLASRARAAVRREGSRSLRFPDIIAGSSTSSPGRRGRGIFFATILPRRGRLAPPSGTTSNAQGLRGFALDPAHNVPALLSQSQRSFGRGASPRHRVSARRTGSTIYVYLDHRAADGVGASAY